MKIVMMHRRGFVKYTLCYTNLRTYKFKSLLTVNVLLILNFVPSALCNTGWSRRLTFDEIYNTTSYAQLQHQSRPYQLQNSSYNYPSFNFDSHRYNLEDIRGNDLEYEVNGPIVDSKEEPLLIGFSHDPFKYSVPKEDYLKGVRDMTPTTIMSKSENRGKRGVLQLYNMMFCATGCEPLAYKGYGCYCGFLGSGEPTDGIDRCCMIHDRCYDNLFCPFFTVYFQPYLWKCYKGRPLCAKENYRTENQLIGGCAAQLCECDRKFAMCVKKYACPRKRSLCFSSPLRFFQNIISVGR